MEKNRRFRLIPIAFLLVALGGILSTVSFVQRSVSEDPIFLGLSTARLIIFFVLVIGIITSFSISLVTRKKELLHFPLAKNRFTASMTGLIFLLGTFYFLSFLPSYYLVDVADLLDNLRPLFFWGFGTVLLFIFVFLFSQFGSHSNLWLAYWKPRHHVWRTALIATGLMIFVAGAGIALRVMEYRDEDFWYSTGVPLLAWQVIFAIVLGILIPRIIRKDKFLFFMIWVIAGVLWASWPYRQTFSMSPPLPPNYESYPIFDATYYDLGSQFALIGEGINGWIFTDRPLYMFFLFSLHKIAGQDYAVLEILQAALFAFFPAIVYLIGQRLHSQQAGITAGLLIIFRGINSLIASPWIDNSHLKDMLIDFPTAVVMGALTLFLVRALQNRKWADLLSATGVLGFALLLRIHTLIYIPLLMAVAAYLLFGQPWKHWLGAGGLLALGLSFTLLPWLLWNSTSVSRFVQFRLERMLEQRYTSTENIAQPRAGRSLSSQPVRQKVSNPQIVDSEVPFQAVHLLHNLMVTPFSLPVTLSLDDIRHTVKENPYWDPSWNGTITPSVMLALSITLLLVALGIGAGTNNGRFAGVTPAIILLAYYGANSFARTSGGRYLVPVDWILFLYLAIGVVELIRVVRVYFGVHTDVSFQKTLLHPNPWSRQTGIILGILLTFGVMIPFIPGLVKPIYPQKLNKRKVINLVYTTELWSLTSLTKDQINGFSSHKKSVAVQGQALYPMYFKQDNGLPLAPKFSQSVRSYPRLVFKVIGPKLNTFVILPSETIPAIPHATEVIVIGCREQHEIQALAVILPEQGVGHIRSPESPLSCPLKIPICDNNKNCQ